jgi:hypothetical protein
MFPDCLFPDDGGRRPAECCAASNFSSICLAGKRISDGRKTGGLSRFPLIVATDGFVSRDDR